MPQKVFAGGNYSPPALLSAAEVRCFQEVAYPVPARLTLFIALILIGGALAVWGVASRPAWAAQTTPTPDVSPTPTAIGGAEVDQYARYELIFPATESVTNPTDTLQIAVDARFTAPDGRVYEVPGFWMQPQSVTCSDNCAIEVIRPSGPPSWRVRFTPPTPGAWQYRVAARTPDGERTLGTGRFTVRPAAAPGFIRVGANGRYFAREDGSAYFPVGPNLAWSWSGTNNTAGYQGWLRRLNELGATYARLYIDVPWFIGLGWASPAGNLAAAQEHAWRLDTLIQAAEANGIALQLVLTWSQAWNTYQEPPFAAPEIPARPETNADWFTNPFNALRGGPFANVNQFFSTEAGRQFYRDRLRYIVARWGYSTSVFAWEMVDQFDRIAPNNAALAESWGREMIAYLRRIDPYDHPVTLGLRDTARLPILAPLAPDFYSVRLYQRRPATPANDVPDPVADTLAALRPLSGSGRPVLLTEFSLNPYFEPLTDDPAAVHVRSTVWATALSGAAGAAASWWWDTYLYPLRGVEAYGPLARFVAGIPFPAANFVPVSVGVRTPQREAYLPLRISGFNTELGSQTPDVVYRLGVEGADPPANTASAFLYGARGGEGSRPHRYQVTTPIDTRLRVNVARVSDRAPAQLVVIVDGLTVAELTLAANSPPTAISVPLSAGEHEIVIDNLGNDFVQLGSIEVEAYIPPIDAVALADRRAGLLLAWFRNRAYTWQTISAGGRPQAANATMSLAGMPPGLYRVEFWDVFTGDVIGQEDVALSGPVDGILEIPLIPVGRMLAVRAIRYAEPGNRITATPAPSATPRFRPTPTATAVP